jgi:hypothetical protein
LSDQDPDRKGRALELILDAWDEAMAAGAEPEVIASVAIYAALADMVDRHGEAAVAEFCAGLPERIHRGEFTLRVKQA